MEFIEFQRLALSSLMNSQEDNGSWLNDEAATSAAIGVLLEEMFGPFASWRHSWIGSYLQECGINSWPLMFSYGVETREEGVSQQKLDAVWKGMNFGRDFNFQKNPWSLIRWRHLYNFVDFDARGIYVDRGNIDEFLEHYSFDSANPWLLAQYGKYLLFADRSFIDVDWQLEKSADVITIIKNLISFCEDNYWNSKSISPQENTAIISQFLFHPGVFHLISMMKNYDLLEAEDILENDINTLQIKVIEWILSCQKPDGSWLNSHEVTTHCVYALVTPLENIEDRVSLPKERMAAIESALLWLLSDDVVNKWDSFRSYSQIEVLALLQKISSSKLLHEFFKSVQISSTRVTRNVFVSYGGCDRDFALRLAKDLEARGLRIWFAEWDIDYGDDVVEEIQNGLEETQKFLIVLSPEAIERKWVRQELSTAFHNALDGKESVVIPVMYKPCQPPPFVRTKKWADFTNNEAYDENIENLARRLSDKKIKRA